VDLSSRLEPVLAVATETAHDVDAYAQIPAKAVDALRTSGLFGLTLSEEVGGLDGGPAELVTAVTGLASACGSTAMIYLMHVAAAMTVAAAPPAEPADLLHTMASGERLGTLAFSEAGSRSHFWAPVSKAIRHDDRIRLDVAKSWVTSAGLAEVYVVSTGSADGDGIDLFAITSDLEGWTVTGDWHGMGMRGNASNPMRFDLEVLDDRRLGAAGTGFDLMLSTVMPWFNLGNASVSVGLGLGAVSAAVRHTSGAKLVHLDQSLAALPTIRAHLAQMSIQLAAIKAYVDQAAARIAQPADDTALHILGVKAAANDAVLGITDAAMRVCGGAAFSEHLQVDRYFRDARAGHVMAPTADVLYDLYGKAITGQPLF
jgi:alkylation response protein AidB-like acyl-CoA dehydrogenase